MDPGKITPGNRTPGAGRRRPACCLRARPSANRQTLRMVAVPALLIAFAVGAGDALGGRLRRFEELRINRWGLAIVALALQFLPARALGTVEASVIGPVMLAVSYTLLVLFLTWNRWIPRGMGHGTWAGPDLIVVVANGGMPVQPEAIERAGGDVAVSQDANEAKHHVMTEQDVLWQLGDVIGVPPPLSAVFSIGDVLLYGGIVDPIVQIMRGRLRDKPRPLALWFPGYRGGVHASDYWRMPVRYRSPGRAATGRSGTEP